MGMENCLSSILIASFFIFQLCVWNQFLVAVWISKNMCASSIERTSEDKERETRQAAVLGFGAAERPIQK